MLRGFKRIFAFFQTKWRKNMFTKKKSIFGFLAASIFLVLVAVPATASADLQKSTLRAQFADGVTQEQRVAFTDNKFNDYVDDGIDGHIVTNDEHAWFLLEGNDTTVDQEIDALQSDNQLVEVELLHESYPETSTLSGLVSHTEYDPRANADAFTSRGSYVKMHLRAKYESNLSTTEKLNFVDSYFSGFSGDGMGGVMIDGNGWAWVTIEIEGSDSDIDYWLGQLRDDNRIEELEMLSNSESEQATLQELVSHTNADSRGSY